MQIEDIRNKEMMQKYIGYAEDGKKTINSIAGGYLRSVCEDCKYKTLEKPLAGHTITNQCEALVVKNNGSIPIDWISAITKDAEV